MNCNIRKWKRSICHNIISTCVLSNIQHGWFLVLITTTTTGRRHCKSIESISMVGRLVGSIISSSVFSSGWVVVVVVEEVAVVVMGEHY
jgi:hypothetical protein